MYKLYSFLEQPLLLYIQVHYYSYHIKQPLLVNILYWKISHLYKNEVNLMDNLYHQKVFDYPMNFLPKQDFHYNTTYSLDNILLHFLLPILFQIHLPFLYYISNLPNQLLQESMRLPNKKHLVHYHLIKLHYINLITYLPVPEDQLYKLHH